MSTRRPPLRLEGKIEMEEVKWQGAAVPVAAGVAAAPVPSGGV
eukprot:COSAG01_NODE_65327_length_273_cov_1.477011_1_plen_42_part_10